MNGKQKGSSFERKICKALSLWVTAGEKQDCFWRSAMSGGRATVAGRKGTDLRRQAGDISAVSPEGHKLTDLFYIECKHYRDLDFDLFLFKRGKLYKFWRTTQAEAKKYQKSPMLIAKQNHTHTVMLSELGCFAEYCKGTDIMMAGEVESCVLTMFTAMLTFSFSTLHQEMS